MFLLDPFPRKKRPGSKVAGTSHRDLYTRCFFPMRNRFLIAGLSIREDPMAGELRNCVGPYGFGGDSDKQNQRRLEAGYSKGMSG